MNPVTDDDLLFAEIRTGTAQWTVSLSGEVVARVTERAIARPRYRVTRERDELEVDVETREEVASVILGWCTT